LGTAARAERRVQQRRNRAQHDQQPWLPGHSHAEIDSRAQQVTCDHDPLAVKPVGHHSRQRRY
jgi:hypothetical protein